MDREMIEQRMLTAATRILELHQEIEEVKAEVADLNAALRVLDRIEGKGEFSSQNKIAKALAAPGQGKFFQHWVQTNYVSKLNRSPSTATSREAAFNALPLKERLAALLSGTVPEPPSTLPQAITSAFELQFNEGKDAASPKEVQTFLEEMSFDIGSQSVNSVMWRMAQRGELVKAPDAPIYWLPKPDDQMGKGVLSGLKNSSDVDREASQEGE